jgi:predicted ribosomally synthesized peptide with SipW-like signal peptide
MTMSKIQLTRRRALGALATIGAGSAAAGAGTFALFSDEETSNGNTLSAGTLDLQTGDSQSISFTGSDIAPGDTGTTAVDLEKSGAVAADLDVEVTSVSSSEGDTPESETNTDTADGGELDDQLNLKLWIGTGGSSDSSFDSSTDITLNSDGSTETSAPDYETASGYDSTSWTDVITDFSGPVTFNVEWEFPDDSSNNAAQGDDVTVDFTFTLTQQS